MTLSAGAYGHTFPLHLPPIDWYFYVDDNHQYPMVFFVDLDFVGSLDKPKFEAALEEACFRHPLTRSVIRPGKRGSLCWLPVDDALPQIDWADQQQLIAEPPAFNLSEHPGLRIWIRGDGERSRMTMQFHHTVCDGTGAYRFIGDLLACYMLRLGCCAGQVKLGEFDVLSLKSRPLKMRSFSVNDNLSRKLSGALRETWKMFSGRVTPLRLPADRSVDASFPGMVKHEFAAAELNSLRAFASSMGATLNDLVLAKLFQSIATWNNLTSGSKRLRILVPADMRGAEDFELPACNMTAYTMISRQIRELADDNRLLDMVRHDTLQIKHGQLQSEFVNALTMAKEAPQILPFLLRRNVCLATCVLSNAGDPSRRFTCRIPKRRGKVACDDFSLEAITGVPPLRKLTRATISSSIYGRKLTFSMRCDPHLYGERDSQELLNSFCQHLRQTTSQNEPTGNALS